jgi:2-polyprenyl-3-methyl-5-hydroxy-6-metoxy-1,4-benzoquinol methylase
MLENYQLFENNIYKTKDSVEKKFNYTDGEESEKYLIELLNSTENLSSNSMELGRKSKDWASFYHLSPRRSNLLRPLKKFLNNKNVLEIGAGCGAITRYLGENTKRTVSVEGSFNRAYINSLRTKDLGNVSIICDNYQDFKSEQKFDIATLIGVLEYSRVYFKSNESPSELAILKKIYEELTEDGSVIIAIENKLGLKYLAGYPEDHLGISMAGVEGHYKKDGVVTFGKVELEELLRKAGFGNILFYYPFPDYKVPTSILCDDLTEFQDQIDLSYILQTSEKMDPQNPGFSTFNLNLAWSEIYKNKLWKDLSNSFLIVASKKSINEDNLAYHYSIERDLEFQKEIIFSKDLKVLKFPIEQDAYSSEEINSSPFFIKLENEFIAKGVNWESEIIRILNTPEWNIQDIADWLRKYITCLSELIGYKDTYLPYDLEIEGKYLDAIPRNLIVLKNGFQFIDLEWNFVGKIKIKQLLLRAFFTTLFEQTFVAKSGIKSPFDYNKWNVYKKSLLILGYFPKNSDFLDFIDQELEFQNGIIFNNNLQKPIDTWIDSNFSIRSNFLSIKEKDYLINERDRVIAGYKNSWSFRIGFLILHPWKIPGLLINKLF